MMHARAIGAAAALATLSCAVGVASAGSKATTGDWRRYVRDYVQRDGRVIDRAAGDVTTSEGAAYAMLRALWSDDRRTFDRVLQWTTNNLQAGDPGQLPSWRWGRDAEGQWGVLDPQPASDADVLMAYALVEASQKWQQPGYGMRAERLMDAIWRLETQEVGEGRVLLPGPWARHPVTVQVNPSYFAPWAFRRLAKADVGRDWLSLVDSSYALLDQGIEVYGLPPDWCWVSVETGALVSPPAGQESKTDFGWEAVRVPWMVAADVRWHGSTAGKALLTRLDVLAERFETEGELPAVIGPGGEARVTYESRALYGALLPAWALTRPEAVPALRARIDDLAPASTRSDRGQDYYAANWVWFGHALWSGFARPVETL